MNQLPKGSVCSVCKQPIEPDDDVMAYKRARQSPNEYAHNHCASSDMLAVLKVFTTYGGRAAKGLR